MYAFREASMRFCSVCETDMLFWTESSNRRSTRMPCFAVPTSKNSRRVQVNRAHWCRQHAQTGTPRRWRAWLKPGLAQARRAIRIMGQKIPDRKAHWCGQFAPTGTPGRCRTLQLLSCASEKGNSQTTNVSRTHCCGRHVPTAAPRRCRARRPPGSAGASPPGSAGP